MIHLPLPYIFITMYLVTGNTASNTTTPTASGWRRGRNTADTPTAHTLAATAAELEQVQCISYCPPSLQIFSKESVYVWILKAPRSLLFNNPRKYFLAQAEQRRKQQQAEYQAEYVRRRVVVAQKAYCIISSSREYTYIFKVCFLCVCFWICVNMRVLELF